MAVDNANHYEIVKGELVQQLAPWCVIIKYIAVAYPYLLT